MGRMGNYLSNVKTPWATARREDKDTGERTQCHRLGNSAGGEGSSTKKLLIRKGRGEYLKALRKEEEQRGKKKKGP